MQQGKQFIEKRMEKTHKFVCVQCNFVHKQYSTVCPNCHSTDTVIDVGSKPRVPRKRASKKKWNEFWMKWVGPVSREFYIKYKK